MFFAPFFEARGLGSMKNKCINLYWLLRVQGSYEVLMLFSSLLFAEMMLAVSASFLSNSITGKVIYGLLCIMHRCLWYLSIQYYNHDLGSERYYKITPSVMNE